MTTTTTTIAASSRLRALLAGDAIVVAPGAYDGLSASLIERAGYQACYVSGGAASVSLIARPDLGLMTGSEMADHVGRLRQATEIPLIVDLDTGYGNEITIRHAVERQIALGAAAIQIEDQTFPKRCGHLAGKEVVDRAEAVKRVRMAVRARGESDIVVIARTDAIATHGLDEALHRAQLFADAGADMVFVEAPTTLDELAAIGSNMPVPAVINVLARSKTPLLAMGDYQELGFKLAIVPAVCVSAAMTAVETALGELSRTGLPPNGAGPVDVFRAVGLDDWSTWALEADKAHE